MVFCSAQGLKALKNYKYSSVDKSYLMKYFHAPCAEAFVKIVPKWIAPNAITVAGLVLLIISVLLSVVYCPTFSEEQPSWVYYLQGVLMFSYNLFDNTDGKQARRTGTSSPLGELVDHGVDSVVLCLENLVFVIAAAYTALPEDYRIVATYFYGALPFLFATWEKFHTGSMYFGIINGPSEGVVVILAIHFMAGALGRAWWIQDWKTLAGITPGSALDILPSMERGTFILVSSCIACVVPTLIVHCVTVVKAVRAKNQSVPRAFARLLPGLTLFSLTFAWQYMSVQQIATHYPRIFYIAVGLFFSMLMGRMNLAGLLKEPLLGYGSVPSASTNTSEPPQQLPHQQNYVLYFGAAFVPLCFAVVNVLVARINQVFIPFPQLVGML